MTSARGLVFAGLAMIAVTYGLARFAYGLFLPELRAAFDLEADVLGVIGAGSYAGYCAAAVVSLVLTARVGARFMVVTAGSVGVLGMALISIAPDAWVLASGVLVAGLGSGLASPPMGEAVAAVISPGEQDRANSLINCGTSVGVILSGPVALLVADQWRVAWAGFAAVGLAVLVWNAAVMPGKKARPAIERWKGDPPRISLRWILGPHSATLLLVAFGSGVSSAAYWTFSRGLVVQAGGLEGAGSTVFWVVIGAFGILGGFAGDLVGRLGLTNALRVSLMCMAAATGLLALAPSVAPAVFASASLFGASYMALTGIILVWSVSVFGERPSAGIGTAFLILAAGQALGSPVAGAFAVATGLEATMWIFAGIAVVTAFVKPLPIAAEAPRGW